ncbi:MAG: DUF2400 family protein, partial [Spirochaetia bacterium]|nr:DUF2400 family protein [Spirochaetia bacterium]
GFPDLGLYHTFDPRELVAPVDVHLMRLARNLGWVQRKTSTWETALAVTDSLRAICPEDPLKYDFALTRLGILKECRSEYVALLCERCDLRSICSVYAAKRPVRRQRNS